jgi:signal transduction histidine kinase
MSGVMAKMIAFDQEEKPRQAELLQSSQGEPLAHQLETLTNRLVDATQAQTDLVVAQNRSSFGASRDLFIAVGGGSIALALALGLLLSWSVIGPIQRTEARLAEIASGDFSGRLDVPNRDELGALAANVNRMNDELGRLYKELETVSQHKSEFLANMSHELRTPLNAIIGFSEVLHEQMFGELNEQQLGYVKDVLDAGRHLLSLINDILDLSKVEMSDGVVEVAVKDTGSGISPEDQEHIFEEFAQARGGDAATRQEGTGLGLPLSRRFIELHGGRLWVESAPGEGSTFRFTLPVRQSVE